MFNFFKKDDTSKNFVYSYEYERLSKRITELIGEIGVCQAAIKLLQTDVDNLRGKFNRKLLGLKIEEEKQEDKKTENYNNEGFVCIG